MLNGRDLPCPSKILSIFKVRVFFNADFKNYETSLIINGGPITLNAKTGPNQINFVDPVLSCSAMTTVTVMIEPLSMAQVINI